MSYDKNFIENFRQSMLTDGYGIREEIDALCDLALRGLKVSPDMTLRDKMASACLSAVYEITLLTDRAAALAYEQADEMLKARDEK